MHMGLNVIEQRVPQPFVCFFNLVLLSLNKTLTCVLKKTYQDLLCHDKYL